MQSLSSRSFSETDKTPTSRAGVPRFTGIERLAWLMLSFTLAVPFGVAALLKPDPNGMGTHRQLGLPPCTMVALFGVRCPTCGMTTSWAHLVRGQVRRSLAANAGGTLLAGVTALAAGWLAASTCRGWWVAWQPKERMFAWLAAVIVTVTAIDWVYGLATGR